MSASLRAQMFIGPSITARVMPLTRYVAKKTI
jgi:hypothetical protein